MNNLSPSTLWPLVAYVVSAVALAGVMFLLSFYLGERHSPPARLTALLGRIADHPVNKLFELFSGNLKLPEKLSSFGALENQKV